MAEKKGQGDVVEEEELEALLKAIKFQHGDYSLKEVHKEVLIHGGKWAKVDVKRVRKALKRLGLFGPIDPHSDEKIMKLFTVGGESKSVLDDAPSAAPGAEADSETARHRWVAVELDVPMDRTGQYPHAALINLNQETESARLRETVSPFPGAEIYKVQVAMGGSRMPMLVYNKQRNRKTFIHSENPAFDEIHGLITSGGGFGAGGPFAGLKAYFWGKVDKSSGVLLLCTTQMAPHQTW